MFYFAKYDAATYAIDDPTECKLWATANGSPFQKKVDNTAETDYYFYINFGDNDTKTGWYSAKAKNADDALAAAIKDKGITVDYGKSGYPNFDNGMWGIFNYTWFLTNPTTATESIVYPQSDSYGGFIKSNGWDSFSGYGTEAKKVHQSMSEVFYFAKYDATTYAIEDPTECKLWATANGSPFAA